MRYWSSSIFACLWTDTKSRSINSQKKEQGQYAAILNKQAWFKGFIIWLLGKLFWRDTAGSPERAGKLHHAHSSSQSMRRIWFTLNFLDDLRRQVEEAAGTSDVKERYVIRRTQKMCYKDHRQTVRASRREMLSDQEEQWTWWVEHFRELFISDLPNEIPGIDHPAQLSHLRKSMTTGQVKQRIREPSDIWRTKGQLALMENHQDRFPVCCMDCLRRTRKQTNYEIWLGRRLPHHLSGTGRSERNARTGDASRCYRLLKKRQLG